MVWRPKPRRRGAYPAGWGRCAAMRVVHAGGPWAGCHAGGVAPACAGAAAGAVCAGPGHAGLGAPRLPALQAVADAPCPRRALHHGVRKVAYPSGFAGGANAMAAVQL